MDIGYWIHTFEYTYLRARLKEYILVPDLMFVMDYYNVIRWNIHKFYSMELSSTIFNGHLLMELKLHIYTLLNITSTEDYYKTIWLLINGTHILYLFQLFNIY